MSVLTMYEMNRKARYDMLDSQLSEHNFNPMNDVLFKFVFGKPERKQITMDFLNAVVSEDLGHPICDIVFAPTELIPDRYDEKLSRLDVACTLDTGEQVDIEVQVINQKNMQRRTLCYWARMYLMSLPPGGDYRDVKPCIMVNLLRFNILPQEEAHSLWSVYNKQTDDRLNKDLVLHFLEIPKFVKMPVSHMTKMERWLAFFANKLNAEEKGELIMSDAAIHDAMKAAREFMQNTAERRAYINREMAIIDYNTNTREAFEKGEEKGIKKGEKRLGTLIQYLMDEHKLDDARRAVQDEAFRSELYNKYGI